MVVKKDGSKQPYDPDKILRSLDVACQKRGVSQQVKENICSDITHLYIRISLIWILILPRLTISMSEAVLLSENKVL